MKLSLRVEGERLISAWTNDGSAPVALAFWWNRRLVVADQHGAVVAPGPGPVLPCGVAEEWTVVEPGVSFERDESLACTQPAGRTEAIGWSYDLATGTWKVSLVWESPRPRTASRRASLTRTRGAGNCRATPWTCTSRAPKSPAGCSRSCSADAKLDGE